MIRSDIRGISRCRLRGEQAPARSAATAPARSVVIVAAFCFSLGAIPAFAEEVAAPTPSAVTEAAPGTLFGIVPLADAELAAVTGREQTNWLNATARNSAVVADNHVGDNSVTGAVNISDSAFQSVNGVAMVNFNTGNNSSINAAMSVNLQINYASPGQ